jgi:hypothetical protein
MNCDLKLRLNLIGGVCHLGAQKGAWAGPPESPDWSPHPDLGTPPEKLKHPDYKGEINRKEDPTWRGFPSAWFCPLSLILRERETQIPVSNKGHT